MKYKISLEGTSRKIGVDLNWPHNAKERSEQIHLPLDMKIDEVNPWIRVTSDEGQTAETKEEGLTDFMVTVNSYDWAGHTKLRVIAELEGSDTVVAHVQGHPEQEELLIPKDENHNDIADGWERQNGVYGADVSSDDDDDPPGSGNGDAIALYDEYRGFHVGGQHEGLSPHKKDLFVYDADGLGVGVYGNSGIRVHVIKDGEFSKKGGHPNPYVVTPNGEHGDVCAIYLHRGPLDSGVIGETLGANDVPCNILGITIDPTVSDGLGKEEGPSYLQSSIAHELSHATKVSHHGPNDLDYVVGDATCQGKAGVENIPCLTPPDKKTGKTQMASDCYEVAVKGGKFSGNAQCWMRYDQTNFYEDPTGNCEWEHNGKTVRGRKYGADPPGMTLCENPRGTGVNDPAKTPNKAGDATFGNCRKQLTLK